MNRAERAAAAVSLSAAAQQITGTARDVHGAVVDLVEDGLDMAGLGGTVAANITMSSVAAGSWLAYGAVGSGLRLCGDVAASLLAASTPDDTARWSDTPAGGAVVAALAGAHGDALDAHPVASALAPPMAVRVDGVAVAADRPLDWCSAPTGTLWLFLHGLVGTEAQWSPRYLALVAELGGTAVAVRYNSGLPIERNGRLLDALVTDLTTAWPVPVERIVIVGHSMGGLVARSALAQAPAGSWRDRVTDLVTLGSPHRGAPLERVSHRALRILEVTSVTRPFAALGHRRSAGIKDLRFGALVPGHWGGQDPDTVDTDPTWDVPTPAGVREHAVVAVLGPGPDWPLAEVVGDGLVPPSSAGSRPGGPHVVTVRLSDTGHLALLDHDAVLDVLRAAGAATPD